MDVVVVVVVVVIVVERCEQRKFCTFITSDRSL